MKGGSLVVSAAAVLHKQGLSLDAVYGPDDDRITLSPKDPVPQTPDKLLVHSLLCDRDAFLQIRSADIMAYFDAVHVKVKFIEVRRSRLYERAEYGCLSEVWALRIGGVAMV